MQMQEFDCFLRFNRCVLYSTKIRYSVYMYFIGKLMANCVVWILQGNKYFFFVFLESYFIQYYPNVLRVAHWQRFAWALS